MELAEKTREAGREMGLEVKIQTIPNPRREKEEHYYNPSHTGLLSLGLQPHFLTTEVLIGLLSAVHKYQDRINANLVMPRVQWCQG
jgi:UDP-sulfoquinovose synthase